VAQAAEGKRCLAIGPAVGTSPPTRQLIHRIVRESTLPMIIDADGLNIVAQDMALLKARRAPTVLTPHPGEMARLTKRSVAEIQADRISAVRQLSQAYQTVVVLKGARTLISDPNGHVWINPTGNPGMASGGMGDVLTGAVAGLITQGCSAVDAAILGVFLHGLAADLLARKTLCGFLATEVMNYLPLAMEHVIRKTMDPIIRGPHL
jgi:NAD(P)H-hydrate epimerase